MRWLLLAAPLAVALAVVATFGDIFSGGGSSAGEPVAQSEVTGTPLKCASGAQAPSLFRTQGSAFEIAGTLEGFQNDRFVVKGPEGPLSLVLAPDARVTGTYLAGDAMHVKGDSAGGQHIATEVTPICPAPSATAAQSPAPTSQAPTAVPIPPAPHPAFPAPHNQNGDHKSDKKDGDKKPKPDHKPHDGGKTHHDGGSRASSGR